MPIPEKPLTPPSKHRLPPEAAGESLNLDLQNQDMTVFTKRLWTKILDPVGTSKHETALIKNIEEEVKQTNTPEYKLRIHEAGRRIRTAFPWVETNLEEGEDLDEDLGVALTLQDFKIPEKHSSNELDPEEKEVGEAEDEEAEKAKAEEEAKAEEARKEEKAEYEDYEEDSEAEMAYLQLQEPSLLL
jgi:hypothetical protein